ncbi:MAG: zinc ribbon domain-containing protein [Candidatus Korobacteraceae bacterium]|jgi:zinc ribbon protein
MLRNLPPAVYLIALICFLFPFIEVSCSGQKVASLSGIDLLTGTHAGPVSEMLASQGRETKPATPVALAFLAGIAGLVMSLLKQSSTSVIGGVCGVFSAGCLLALQQSLTSGAPPEALGLIQVQYQPGYYLSVLLFFGGAAVLFYSEFSKRPAVAAAPPSASPPVLASPPVAPMAGTPVPPPEASYAAAAVSSSPAPTQATVEPASPGPAPAAFAVPSPATVPPRFCTHCGQQLAPEARFCAKCGAALA